MGGIGVRQMIQSTLQRTCHRLNNLPEELSPALLNESVFRFFFVQSLLEAQKNCKVQQEWRRYDLLIQHEGQNILVEFKFYHRPRCTNLAGDQPWAKGGPGKKNFEEFIECVRQLATVDKCRSRKSDKGKIDGRYLVLVYLDDPAYRNCYERVAYPET